MTTQISGDTGVSQVQDGVIVAADFAADLFAVSAGTDGYQKLPSGIIIQWGVADYLGSGEATVSLPIPFPNVFLSIVVSPRDTTNALFCQAQQASLSQIKVSAWITNNTRVAANLSYIAIGY